MKTISTPYRRVLENVVDNLIDENTEITSFDTATFILVASSANFPTTGNVGDIVFNAEDSRQFATIVSVDSTTQVTLDGSIGLSYYYSVAPAATAFLLVTQDAATASYWMATYSVGDRVNCVGAAQTTTFNLGLATILSLDYDGTVGSETATMTLDLPMSTDDDVFAYVEGELQTLPVNELIVVKFILDEEAGYAEFALNGDAFVYLYQGIYEPDEPSLIQLENNVMGAIQEVLRSPWPKANVMIKDSYGMYFDY
ncbi:unnamed protein product [marine sediment metagenome]|uniref:Uncharacterized protein n=1 Tax=marine sediment metagenome TaxID=412755 RepID=X0RXS6_9ZZZZ